MCFSRRGNEVGLTSGPAFLFPPVSFHHREETGRKTEFIRPALKLFHGKLNLWGPPKVFPETFQTRTGCKRNICPFFQCNGEILCKDLCHYQYSENKMTGQIHNKQQNTFYLALSQPGMLTVASLTIFTMVTCTKSNR